MDINVCFPVRLFLVVLLSAIPGPVRSADLIALGADPGGVADSRPAFAAALTALNSAGGGILDVPPGRYRIVATAANLCLGVQSNVTIRGVRGASILSVESDDPASYRELLRLAGDRITLDGITLTRRGQFTGIMVKVYPSSRLTLRGMTIDGATSQNGPGVHGIEIAPVAGGVTEGFRLDDCDVSGCNNGLLMTNESTATLGNFTATGCRFSGNYADLDFNAPQGTMDRIALVACDFADGTSPSSANGGFAVGFANVHRSRVIGCDFHGYKCETIHIEDRSSAITIGGCTFRDCASQGYGVINMINAANHIVIENNHFDASSLTTPVPCVLVATGDATFPVAGDVLIEANTMRLGKVAVGVEAYGSRCVSMSNNHLIGGGPGSSGYGYSIRHATGARVTGNTLRDLPMIELTDPAFPSVDSFVGSNVTLNCGVKPPGRSPTPVPLPSIPGGK